MQLENIKLNTDTKLVLNVGYPMEKTNAPRAYNKLFSLLGMNALMLPVNIQKGELASFLDACKTLNILYFSPTMPHKADIIPFLDEVDESSRLFKSVNAVRIDKDGRSYGVGMDGKGAVSALQEGGVKLEGAAAVLLGAGSICGVIGLELSRSGVKKLTILDRTEEKAQELARILAENTPMELAAMKSAPENLDSAARDADVFLQATPLGMAGYAHTHAYLGFIEKLPSNCVVFDVIINPPDTPVIAAAKARGLKTIPGMKMLAGQMTEIFDFMFGIKLSEEHKAACIQELCDFLGIAAP